MKRQIISLLLLLPLLFTACKKCGEDVNLGDFEAMPQSFTDWYPYIGVETLTFKNAQGDQITLSADIRKEEMELQSFRDICKGNKVNDAAKEFYRSERLLVEYSALVGDNTYFLSAILNVDRISIQGQTNNLILFDKITYRSRIQDYNGPANLNINGMVILLANDRGNNLGNEDIWNLDEVKFLNETLINGKTFQNIWYVEVEGKPVLFVQKGIGIIAFRGFNDQIWVRE